MISRRGTEKIQTAYWFTIIVLVAGSIVFLVGTYGARPFDVRALEADILGQKFADCFVQGGVLSNTLISSSEPFSLSSDFLNDPLAFCKITYQVENQFDWKEQSEFASRITFFLFDSNSENGRGLTLATSERGSAHLFNDCGISKKSAVCSSREFFTLDSSGKSYVILVDTAVRKVEKNVI